MSSRRRAREVVLQVLFQRDLNPGAEPDLEFDFLKARLHHDSAVVEFAGSLIRGIESHAEAIDTAIQQVAENWKLYRMAATDRNILRIATFEILFSATPGKVAINEAIELAKRYGSNQSFQFVNGLLDRMLKNSESPVEPAACDPNSTSE